MVGFSNKTRSGKSTRNFLRIREISRVARRECPPILKKSASRSTEGRSSTSIQIASIRPSVDSSVTVPGRVTAGMDVLNAMRSTFPFAFSGKLCRNTKRDGTM